MKSSFPRQLSISAAVLVLFLMPLLYAGQVENDSAANDADSAGINNIDGDYMFTAAAAEMALYSPDDFVKRVVVTDIHDFGYVLYEDSAYKSKIIDYYSSITGSQQIAESLLRNAHKNEIPFSLAISLMWAESGFNPEAYNKNVVSIDRGLYQLNSESFPDMTVNEFYDIETNIATGLSYLRYCLNLGESEIVALAIYNAGHGRVSGKGAPLMTLEYISKIVEYRSEIERDFERYISRDGKIRADKTSERNVVQVRKLNSKQDLFKK